MGLHLGVRQRNHRQQDWFARHVARLNTSYLNLDAMYKFLFFLLLVTPSLLATEVDVNLEDVSELEATDKSGSLTLSDATYVVPVLIAIILVDFAIFGAFASRSDELNP